MRIHSISTICRKYLMLLALLLASIQMVHAQEESGGTTTTEMKVYGDSDLIATKYAGGSGTKDDPWLISNDLELAKLAHDVTNGTTKAMFAGKYFKLNKDINLNKGKWMPIGTWKCNKSSNDRYFAGKFDGDGHTISNMKIEWVNEKDFEASWGLFGRLYGTSASSEDTYASVTNLIIENAHIQKKKDTAPVGKSVIKIGTVAGDMTQYAEISNIIIRNSEITDNRETYSAPNSFRVGGVIGYIDNSKSNHYRIFNISADVDVNMLTNATLTSSSNFQATIAGGFGSVSKLAKPAIGNIVILPRNILIHGKLTTSTVAAKCKKGSVISSNTTDMDDFDKVNVDNQPITSTWYYTSTNTVEGSKDYKYGTVKSIDAIDESTGMTFGKTFVDQINQYLSDKKLDRKSWAYLGKSKFTFSTVKLNAKRGKQDVLTVVNEDGTTNNEKYDWFVSQDNMKWEKANTDNGACNPFYLPRQKYKQYVYAVSSQSSLRTNTIEVKAIGITAQLDDKTKPGTYIVNVTNDTEEKLSNDDLGLTITYEWHNGIDPVTGSTTHPNEYTPTTTSHKYKYYCKVIVKSGDNVLFDKNVCASVIVYLCPAGVTTADGKTYAAGTDNLQDDEWGYSPDKPMLTWQGAYKKLSDKASWDENIIVLMGTSNKEVTKGFNITQNYQGDYLLIETDWKNAKKNNPELFRNATITGKWDKDYKGQIEIYGSSRGLPIWGDTRFEHITFNNNGGDSYKIIYCQYNNLEMGDSIKMTNFGVNDLAYGSITGAVTTPLHIFGGLNNDGRYQPLNTPELIKAFEKSMPHGKEGFSITIKSGYYSIISTGGRQTATEGLNGVMGTPNQPIKCTITMDIDRKWNDANNEKRPYDSKEDSKERGNDYDAGAILAGSHEGAMYADVDIIVKSGKVARVVNGTLGANTQLSFTYGNDNTTYYVPCNTYMGRANITIDPAKSEYNHDDNINGRVIITELYGGSMGRAHHANATINNPFYGISNITINGGTFKVLPDENADNKEILCGIFGAGAGGMNGIGYGDDTATTHTPDANIAYWNAEKNVMLYGTYSVAKNNLVTYTCYNVNTESTVTIDPKDTQTNIIINGGEFGTKTQDGKINAIDGIYAGGSGFMGLSLWTQKNAKPSQYGGNVYGQKDKTKTVSSLTINGGTFYCKNGIFGGGRGTDYFFHENKYGGTNYSDYKELGQTYGNVTLNITGGTFYCPIFGGGYGVAYATENDPENKKDTPEILSDMARLFGKSTISIEGGTFYDNVYGGGDMAQTEDTELSISDYADIRGSVFAGGNGREKIVKANDENWHPEYIGRVTGSTSLTFSGSSAQAPSIYGNIYGGGNLAQVGEKKSEKDTNGEDTNGEDTNKSSTTINIYGANFAGEIFGGGKGIITKKNEDKDGKETVTTEITSADVNGNTNIYLAQDPGLQTREKDGNLKDNFSINVIWNKLWDGTKFISWDDEKTLFYGKDKDEDPDEAKDKFLNPHNIYGGGNLACTVTGTATVNVQKGMTPYSLLKTQEWKESYDDNKNPHFSVFGGGYGENTSVGSTDVTVNVEGEYGEYNGEVDDDTEQLARPHRSKSKSKSKSTNNDTNKDMNVFDNSKGVPNFTILSALGGGYAGTVINDTKVTVDGNTFLHRVYGGGFGDPDATTADNKTGSIGGNTQVFVKGAYIHGDVFGGGAGVNPKKPNGTYTYFTNVAKVPGTTLVEISDEAKIYGSVFGGGDIANIGDTIETPKKPDYYTIKPISVSTIAQNDSDGVHQAGEFISYKAENYKTFVNLKGGDIFGEVFGGGKGLKLEDFPEYDKDAPEYDKVGRINGNTLVHIVNTDAASSTELDYQNNVVPFVWNNVYGGCAYGTVDGNTLVHVEGGKLGQNIYGGGYGHVKVDLDGKETEAEKQKKTRQTVLGKKDTDHEGTYANILGNTQVQIDGGTWIWNRKADSKGNFTTWLAAQTDSEKICDNIEEFKEITAAILKAKTADEITNEKAKAAINRIMNNENTQQFFEFTKGTMNSGSFKRNHNIYGGGNRACYVGTYTNDSTVADKTGEAIVIVNHSPLTDIIIKNQDNSIKKLSLFDETSLPGLCWYISSKNTNDPEFSVFGAGFGANTKVGKTQVYVQPGAKINDDGILTIDGIKYRYLNQAEDHKTYFDFEMSIYNDFLKVSKEDKKLYFGSVTGSNPGEEGFDPMTYRRYHASRWAWILGLPAFTFQAIHGGGYSGYVTGDTYVETDAQPVCENIYGAGLGALPYGDFTDGNGYDFGKVGISSKVFIKSGFIAQNVYGGGAGIESIYKNDTWIDFPNMARVPKTEAHIYGRNFNYMVNGKSLGTIDRTMIWGSVYGGGDVANVGYTKADPDVFTYEQHKVPKNCTSLVNIRGGAIFSQVFAGGKGRLASECSKYQNLGGIYGNSCLVIDRPAISYPYYDEATRKALEPWSTEAMAHPDTTVNANIIPTFHERIYGGCQNGTVYGNTFISIWDGYIGHGIYGGGWGNSDSQTVNEEKTTSNGEKITFADVTGNTNMIIRGGKALISSYWNPNTRSWNPASIIDGITYSPQYNHETLKFKINHNIYGGGNEACEVYHNTNITITKGFLHDDTEVKPGQAKDSHFYQTAEWKEIYYKVGSPHFSIFGGGYGEDAIVKGNTNINIDMVREKKIHFGIGFELGKEYEHFYSGYSYMDIVGGGYSGKVEGSTNIKGAGGAFCRRVFGGGFYSSVNSTNITVKAIDCHDIFGGGFMGDVEQSTNVTIGEDNSKTATTSGDETSGTDTTTSGNNTSGEPSGKSPYDNTDIYIHGSVYGGNDVSGYVNIVLDSKGYFKDNLGTGTNIKINGGHIYGNVYGAGNGNYLYANDRNGNTKVTVNEYYPLNPDDPNSEKVDLVYTVPMRETMPSIKAASDAAKIVNINSWRPLTNKVKIDITGNTGKVGTDNKINSKERMVVIDGDVYGGGNSATVQKVYDYNDDSHKKVGDIKINIGSHVNIRSVFMGSNGDELFTATAENDFMNMFQRLNGSVEDYTKELNLGDSIDWVNDPSNKVISTLYLPTKNEDRPKVYPHLIDLYFHPVETDIQGTLTWNGSATGEGLTDCTIGTFCCGGNRGNMNVYPKTAADFQESETKKIGNVVDYIFPEGLTITDKIVGGCNNANYDYKGKATHTGGYLLGLAHSEYPFIKLTIKNKFEPKTDEKNNAYMGGNVYGGCYQSGTIKGDVTIDLQSDMLAGKNKTKLENSNDLLLQSAKYASLNIYGAGYGMESYVYGNTHILMGENIKCVAPTMNVDKANNVTLFNACGVKEDGNQDGLGVSANFVYGGGQQGNVIGITNVDILNGHVFRAVTGGSYSGYVYGSTQVKVGYPKYYKVRKDMHKGGRYVLKRTDQKNLGLEDFDGKTTSPTVKQHIYLLSDELITQGTREDIVAIDNGNRVEITDADSAKYFTTVNAAKPKVGWDNVHINIDEAVYGGGYSLAEGSSVMANNTTVLKYTKEFNVDEAFTDTKEHLDELNGFPNGTTVGFGGNTVILVGDNKNSEHITISHQEMQEIKLPEGTDLFGYYYKHYDDAEAYEKGIYTYRFISLQDKYFYHAGTSPKLEGLRDNVFYEYDSEGGIFGDGHLSYAEGFRSTDITGYGFAAHTIDNPKIINTFQRIDILRLEDNCFTLLGARDYTVNEINKAPYSIARVGELKMVSNEIAYNKDSCLQAKADDATSFKYGIKARNYMGLSNNIHYVGAVVSDVPFNDKDKAPWRNHQGQVATAVDENGNDFTDKSYQQVKQIYIDNYNAKKDSVDTGNAGDIYGIFQRRNDGTAKNMIGIASGYAMKIQLCQVTCDTISQKVSELQHYGPIYGVIEMNLINVREDEGGGYVYADNNHKREADKDGKTHKEDFLETTGNFVFPYKDGRYIVDDCFPTGYYSSKPDSLPDIHYWYVTGFHYYYNAHITGYTFKSSPDLPFKFNSDNKDGLTVLSGLKSGQTARIYSWKMRSGHPEKFSSDLEYRNYLKKGDADYNADVANGYQLYVGGSKSTTFEGATAEGGTQNGFSALLSMNAQNPDDNYKTFNGTLPSGLTEDAKISFQLVDKVNNTNDAEADYFKKHLAEKSLATLVIKAPAYERYVSESDNTPIYAHTGKLFQKVNDDYIEITSGKLKDPANTYYQPQTDEYVKVEELYVYNSLSKKYEVKALSKVNIDTTKYYVPREYTYTIYLTIEYVQGPTVSGNISIENCALPGEMIRINKKLVKIDADESFAANGYYWHIGKLKRDKDGKPEFEDGNTWVKDIFDKKDTPQNNTYQQGTATDNRTDLFAGTYYDKTEDYLEIPAYYFMNGYGVQLAISMTGFDKQLFPVPVQLSDTLVVHNYQEMDPQSDKVNLHIPEAVKRAREAAEARAKGEPQYFAEPRIYIKNQLDLTAFKKYLQEESNDGGAYAQFILQRDLSIGDNIDGTGATFKGTFHGNGHVLKGFSKDKALFLENQGQIYNLGLENGNIATNGCNEKGAYHCCFEYNPTNPTNPIGNTSPIVYRMDGTAEKGYTYDDFKYGKVAYDLNEYYLRARYSNNMTNPDDKAALKYIYDYYANGDYQYANRSDAYTGNNTGIVYLRTGGSSALTPNYGKSLTRHDQKHTIDKARAQEYKEATETEAESRTGDYLPLFNKEQMNDFLFWGQSLQLTPDNYPTEITSRHIDYMTNRVYRTAGYYGDTLLDAFHYNAYNSTKSQWSTYVYEPTTTAIDFTCLNDLKKGIGKHGIGEKGVGEKGIFYPPVADNAQKFYDLMIKSEVTQNLLVYTAANSTEAADTEEANTTEAYDIVHTALNYDEEQKEILIKGHHLVANKNSVGTGNGTGGNFTTPYFHLVERTPEGKNSENENCINNDFCAPIPFTVTKHAWYVRKPMYYAEETTGAWEGISLPFTVNKVKAQVNGEITHFYGTPTEDELADPAKNTHTLHHEYWLRGLTGINTGGNTGGNTGVNTGETTATFQRPGSEAGLFQAENAASWNYSFKNDFFVRTYESKLYNKVDNPYYNNVEPHTYNDYLALTANIPYVVRFPGYRYYEFDLSSKFYNEYTQGLGIDTPAQTVTFHAYGREYEPKDGEEIVEKGAIEIPITASTGTLDVDGYSHMGTFKAQKVANGTIYGMNDKGTAFSDAFAETSLFATVMPFRTYLTPAATTSQARSSAAPSVIRIADTTGIEKIEPDVKITDDDDPSGNYLIVQPIGGRRIRIESTYATQLQVFSTTGQLYRILDVQPGTATYSGFYPSIYIFGNKKVIVR